MNPIALSFAAGLTASLLISSSSVTHADEAPWGCQILLCAASSAPGWQSVPYCVSPMVKLITAMKKPGFSWPICPGATSGPPGIQPYEDCPAGTTPYEQDQALCKKPDNCVGFNSDRNCSLTETIPRLLKADPYYYDIDNGEGQSTRHWFNMRY